ncbi:MAG TPA: hypothetical protein DCM15_01530, partial [Cryomorphaceae bacterium]|nr:hypothetical protein [Cryomorphaceae bacterium]
RVFLELVRLDIITREELQKNTDFIEAFKLANPSTIQAIGLAVDQAKKDRAEGLGGLSSDQQNIKLASSIHAADVEFAHL